MTFTLDLIAGISILAAVNLLYVAGLSWFEARGRQEPLGVHRLGPPVGR